MDSQSRSFKLLQAAIAAVRDEVQAANQIFEIEENNVSSSTFIDNAILYEDEQIEDNFNFSDDLINANTTSSEETNEVISRHVLERVEKENINNEDSGQEGGRSDDLEAVENENNIDHTLYESEEKNSGEERDSDPEIDVRKRKKRRLSDPRAWKYNTIKKNRENGAEYFGRKNNKFEIKKAKRVMKMRCQCTDKSTKGGKAMRIQCFKLTDENRKSIFSKFWSLSWPEKKHYIAARVSKDRTTRARHRNDPGVSQRTVSYRYFLKNKGDEIRVCKLMFCNTLGVSMRTISDWINKELSSPSTSAPVEPTTKPSKEKKILRFDNEKENLHTFLEICPN